MAGTRPAAIQRAAVDVDTPHAAAAARTEPPGMVIVVGAGARDDRDRCPAVILAIIDGVVAALRPQQLGADVAYLERELAGIDGELANLAEAIARGGQLPPLLEALTVRQAHRDELVAAIAARQAVDTRRFDRKAIADMVHRHVTAWRALLARRIEGGRQLLRELLAGPLKFTPEGRTYRFEGEASVGQLLAGVAGLPTVLASPTGFTRVYFEGPL